MLPLPMLSCTEPASISPSRSRLMLPSSITRAVLVRMLRSTWFWLKPT